MSRVQVAILSLIAGIFLGMCACGLALLVLSQGQLLDLASLGWPATSPLSPPTALGPLGRAQPPLGTPAIARATWAVGPPATGVPTDWPTLPPPTASPAPTPTATREPWIRPTPLPPPPTVPILPLGTLEIAKCEQPSVITALLQAVEPITSVRVRGEILNNGVEGSFLLDQVLDEEGVNSRGVLSVQTGQGMTQTQGTIIIRNLIWEKPPGGAWGPPRTMVEGEKSTGPLWADWFSVLIIKGKIGTTLATDRPIDIYWAVINEGEGALHVDPQTCLPVRFTTTDERQNKRTSLTFEWGVPITITPPGP
jgi:hypothetical protein